MNIFSQQRIITLYLNWEHRTHLTWYLREFRFALVKELQIVRNLGKRSLVFLYKKLNSIYYSDLE